MKKLMTLFLVGMMIVPMTSFAILGVDEPVSVDECDDTGGYVATNFSLCQQLKTQILQLQMQILIFQLQLMQKAQTSTVGLTDTPARFRDGTGNTPTDIFEAQQRSNVTVDGASCRNGKVVLHILGGGDWQEVLVKVWGMDNKAYEWNTRIKNGMGVGGSREIRKEAFELNYDLGRYEDIKGIKLAYQANVYADAPTRLQGHYVVATDYGEFVGPDCSKE